MPSALFAFLDRPARALRRLGESFIQWCLGWWQVLFIGAQLTVLAFSPSSYHGQGGGAVLRHVYWAAGPGLAGFTTLMTLFNVVLIRIVVVTAFAYGLSQYALDTVVRVLVLPCCCLSSSAASNTSRTANAKTSPPTPRA